MATWTIANLERNVADGGVTVAHWRVTETETVGEGDDAVLSTQNFCRRRGDSHRRPLT